MRFCKKFNLSSPLAFRWAGVVAVWMVGLLLLGDSASGYQADSNRGTAVQSKTSGKTAHYNRRKCTTKETA